MYAVSRYIALCNVNSFTEATEFQLCVCFPCKQQVFRICKSLGAIESNDVRVQEEINICKRDERSPKHSKRDQMRIWNSKCQPKWMCIGINKWIRNVYITHATAYSTTEMNMLASFYVFFFYRVLIFCIERIDLRIFNKTEKREKLVNRHHWATYSIFLFNCYYRSGCILKIPFASMLSWLFWLLY